MRIGTCFFGVAFGLASVSPVIASDCNPNGVGMQQIACIEDQNEADAKKLGGNWPQLLKSYQSICVKEYPGGGSGGREDRAACVSELIKKAAKK